VRSFVRHLDSARVSWGWFVHNVAPTLWAVDRDYPLRQLLDEHVAWFDGHLRPPYFDDRFIQRAAGGKLPSVSWIDPSFADLQQGVLSLGAPPSNDDHPPSDVRAGQTLVLKLYDAIASSPNWSETLLVISYDEHGGFYDHVSPPANPPDDDARTFSRYGVRVPALVVSPLVGRRSVSHLLFDHTSIIKTILLRFCRQGNTIPDMGKRVAAANHLGVLLTEDKPRPPEAPQLYRPLAQRVAVSRQDSFHDELVLGATARASATAEPTDLQHDYLAIRSEFMSQLIEELPETLIRSL
jgi:phospholipase C